MKSISCFPPNLCPQTFFYKSASTYPRGYIVSLNECSQYFGLLAWYKLVLFRSHPSEWFSKWYSIMGQKSSTGFDSIIESGWFMMAEGARCWKSTVSGVLVGRGKDEGAVGMTQVLVTLPAGECQPFRFTEVGRVTTCELPVLLLSCTSASQETFASIEALQINIISQVTLSPPAHLLTRWVDLLILLSKASWPWRMIQIINRLRIVFLPSLNT